MKKDVNIPNDMDHYHGYYVEGDYMVEETNESKVIFVQENKAKFRLLVSKHPHSLVLKPNNGLPDYVYGFDNKEDWEDFCEATWQTDNYIAMKRRDFIEFFRALQFVHSYHTNQLFQAKLRQDKLQKEIDNQETNLNELQKIIKSYEEIYNESKV